MSPRRNKLPQEVDAFAVTRAPSRCLFLDLPVVEAGVTGQASVDNEAQISSEEPDEHGISSFPSGSLPAAQKRFT